LNEDIQAGCRVLDVGAEDIGAEFRAVTEATSSAPAVPEPRSVSAALSPRPYAYE
jgi:hypothetical protein